MTTQTITLYGITNCDTVKKARAWLTDQGVEYQFHDFKKQGLAAGRLDAWLELAGWETLLNRRGNIWRGLDDASKAAVTGPQAARRLMLAQPNIIKRPVVEWGGNLTVGFDEARWRTLIRD